MDLSHRRVQKGTLAIRTDENVDACTIRISGELDLSNVEALEVELKGIRARDSGTVVLDMQELEFIDSTGIALLVNLLGLSGEGSPAVEFILSRSPAVTRVLEVTGLADRLPLAKPSRSQ